MNEQPDLKGLRVLVVENDYLLAWDTGDALRRAGAEVVGPVASEDDALSMTHRGDLHAAVTDINPGRGPSFKTAQAFKEANIPFIFLTWYDQLSVPKSSKPYRDS